MTSDSSRTLMIPSPSGVVRSRSSTSNSGSPKKTSAPSCSRTIDRAQEHADRRARHPAVVGEDRLALVGRQELERRLEVLEVEQRQVVVVAVLEDQGEDRGLGLVEVEDLAEQQRPERVDRRPDLGAELARQRQELDRVAGRLERPAERRDALDDLRVGRVARRREAGQVALDVGDEDRHAGLRQLAGHAAGASWSCRSRSRRRSGRGG